MNAQQTLQAAHDKALARATAEGITVTATGKASGERLFWVNNSAGDGEYIVRWQNGERRLHCNCQAGQRMTVCKHAAVVRAYLINERAAQAAKPAPAPVAVEPSEGIYTVVMSDERWTFRVRRQADDSEFMPGKLCVYLLTGPDNETSYTPFGMFSDGALRTWKRFRSDSDAAQAARVLLTPEEAQAAGYAYALASSRCYHCNRTLTVPTSIHRGLGPDCAAQLGVA